jgi:hypothetical protein
VRTIVPPFVLVAALASGCVPTPAGPVPLPAVVAFGADSAVRGAQGEQPSLRYDVWDVVQAQPEGESPVVDGVIRRIEEACPAARGRLDNSDSGTLLLRRWGDPRRSEQADREVQAWLAAERLRLGLEDPPASR